MFKKAQSLARLLMWEMSNEEECSDEMCWSATLYGALKRSS